MVHVTHVDLLVQERAQVLDRCFEHQLFGEVLDQPFGVPNVALKVFEAWPIFHLKTKSFNHFSCGIEILDGGFGAIDLLDDFNICFGVQKLL